MFGKSVGVQSGFELGFPLAFGQDCQTLFGTKRQWGYLIDDFQSCFCSIPGCFPYNVTKTAITGLVRSLTIEWGPKIRTVGVAPGFIDTAGNDTWFNSFPDAMAERQRTINLHPVKKSVR